MIIVYMAHPRVSMRSSTAAGLIVEANKKRNGNETGNEKQKRETKNVSSSYNLQYQLIGSFINTTKSVLHSSNTHQCIKYIVGQWHRFKFLLIYVSFQSTLN